MSAVSTSEKNVRGKLNGQPSEQECLRRSTSGDGNGGDKTSKKEPERSVSRERSGLSRSLKWMKPDKFDGRGSVETFLAQFDICADYNEWSDTDRPAHVKCSVTGIADQLLWDSGRPSALSYDELREKLRRRFGSDDQQEKFQAELRDRRRRRGEPLAELYQDVRKLMTLAYPGEGNSSLCEQIAKDYFIASLADRDLELKIREREPRDLETAFRHAVRLEAYERAVDGSYYPEQQKVKSGRNKYEDGLARKVTQLESKLEQVQKQKLLLAVVRRRRLP